MRRVCASLLAVMFFTAFAPTSVTADVTKLRRGQPAPYDGALFDEAATVRAAATAEDLEWADRLIEALKAQVEGKDVELAALRQAIAELRAQNRALELANAKADGRADAYKEIVDVYKGQVAQMATQMERMERRMFWNQVLAILGPIGLVIGVGLLQ